jgi:hypothetical protein
LRRSGGGGGRVLYKVGNEVSAFAGGKFCSSRVA